jgi:hypothetical protein
MSPPKRFKRPCDLQHGDQVIDPEHGTLTVSRRRWQRRPDGRHLVVTWADRTLGDWPEDEATTTTVEVQR